MSDEENGDPYGDWTDDQLKLELEHRGLQPSAEPSAWIAQLVQDDEDTALIGEADGLEAGDKDADWGDTLDLDAEGEEQPAWDAQDGGSHEPDQQQQQQQQGDMMDEEHLDYGDDDLDYAEAGHGDDYDGQYAGSSSARQSDEFGFDDEQQQHMEGNDGEEDEERLLDDDQDGDEPLETADQEGPLEMQPSHKQPGHGSDHIIGQAGINGSSQDAIQHEKSLDDDDEGLGKLLEDEDEEAGPAAAAPQPPRQQQGTKQQQQQQQTQKQTEKQAQQQQQQQQKTAGQKVPAPAPHKPEWDAVTLPRHWVPQPCIKISGIPASVAAEELQEVLAGPGQLIIDRLDMTTAGNKSNNEHMQVAYVRLPPPPSPWRQQEPGKTGPDTPADAVPTEQQLQVPGGPPLTAKQRRQLKRRQELAARALERDAYHIARRACLHLVEKKLTVHDKSLALDAAMEQVTLFIGGVLDSEEEVFHMLSPFGPIVRTLVVTNPVGRSKHYAFVEFALPSSAQAALKAINTRTGQTASKPGSKRGNPSAGTSPMSVSNKRRKQSRTSTPSQDTKQQHAAEPGSEDELLQDLAAELDDERGGKAAVKQEVDRPQVKADPEAAGDAEDNDEHAAADTAMHDAGNKGAGTRGEEDTLQLQETDQQGGEENTLEAACKALLVKKWKAYFSFPRSVRDLFSNTLLLVGLPAQLRQNEEALNLALSRYGTVAALQVFPLGGRNRLGNEVKVEYATTSAADAAFRHLLGLPALADAEAAALQKQGAGSGADGDAAGSAPGDGDAADQSTNTTAAPKPKATQLTVFTNSMGVTFIRAADPGTAYASSGSDSNTQPLRVPGLGVVFGNPAKDPERQILNPQQNPAKGASAGQQQGRPGQAGRHAPIPTPPSHGGPGRGIIGRGMGPAVPGAGPHGMMGMQNPNMMMGMQNPNMMMGMMQQGQGRVGAMGMGGGVPGMLQQRMTPAQMQQWQQQQQRMMWQQQQMVMAQAGGNMSAGTGRQAGPAAPGFSAGTGAGMNAGVTPQPPPPPPSRQGASAGHAVAGAAGGGSMQRIPGTATQQQQQQQGQGMNMKLSMGQNMNMGMGQSIGGQQQQQHGMMNTGFGGVQQQGRVQTGLGNHTPQDLHGSNMQQGAFAGVSQAGRMMGQGGGGVGQVMSMMGQAGGSLGQQGMSMGQAAADMVQAGGMMGQRAGMMGQRTGMVGQTQQPQRGEQQQQMRSPGGNQVGSRAQGGVGQQQQQQQQPGRQAVRTLQQGATQPGMMQQASWEMNPAMGQQAAWYSGSDTGQLGAGGPGGRMLPKQEQQSGVQQQRTQQQQQLAGRQQGSGMQMSGGQMGQQAQGGQQRRKQQQQQSSVQQQTAWQQPQQQWTQNMQSGASQQGTSSQGQQQQYAAAASWDDVDADIFDAAFSASGPSSGPAAAGDTTALGGSTSSWSQQQRNMQQQQPDASGASGAVGISGGYRDVYGQQQRQQQRQQQQEPRQQQPQRQTQQASYAKHGGQQIGQPAVAAAAVGGGGGGFGTLGGFGEGVGASTADQPYTPELDWDDDFDFDAGGGSGAGDYTAATGSRVGVAAQPTRQQQQQPSARAGAAAQGGAYGMALGGVSMGSHASGMGQGVGGLGGYGGLAARASGTTQRSGSTRYGGGGGNTLSATQLQAQQQQQLMPEVDDFDEVGDPAGFGLGMMGAGMSVSGGARDQQQQQGSWAGAHVSSTGRAVGSLPSGYGRGYGASSVGGGARGGAGGSQQQQGMQQGFAQQGFHQQGFNQQGYSQQQGFSPY